MVYDIVAKNDDVLWLMYNSADSADKQLKSNCFCPANISKSMQSVPIWDKSPGTPSGSNNDANSKASTVTVSYQDGCTFIICVSHCLFVPLGLTSFMKDQ